MGIIPRTVEWALKIAAKIAEFHDLERELYDRVLYVLRWRSQSDAPETVAAASPAASKPLCSLCPASDSVRTEPPAGPRRVRRRTIAKEDVGAPAPAAADDHSGAEVTADGDGTRLELGADSLEWAAGLLARLGAEFRVIRPDELRVELGRLAERLGRA